MHKATFPIFKIIFVFVLLVLPVVRRMTFLGNCLKIWQNSCLLKIVDSIILLERLR